MADEIEPGIYGLTPRRVPSGKKQPDITWLMGRHLAAIEKMDWSWFFRLDDGSVIATESTWRVVTPQGVVITSEDHDQQFGRPAPVDAADVARKEIAGLAVSGCDLDSKTGDLNLEFGSVRLQFLCLSRGYESWRTTHGIQDVVCTGGGKIVEFIPERE
jgi:hypothetical protein